MSTPAILTAKEVKVLTAVAELCADRNDDGRADYLTTVHVFTVDVCDDLDMSSRSLGGVFSSLVKKGLLYADVDSPLCERTCHLTDAGAVEFAKLACQEQKRTKQPQALGGTSMIIEQMPPANCPEVSCVNWSECGGNVSTSKIRNAAELRMCPACGVPLVLTWDTGAECVRVWPASGQLASYLLRSSRNWPPH